MAVLQKIKRALRGEVKLTTAALEVLNRGFVSFNQRQERAGVYDNKPLELEDPFGRLTAAELLGHFRGEREAKFFSGFSHPETAELQRQLFPQETLELIAAANRIVDDHSWRLLGFDEKSFGNDIQWRRDPLSDYVWPLDYHADVQLRRTDGSDVRVLWELNRLGHFITLARAYVLTHDERYSAEFFAQLKSWHEQNPCTRGPNWNCAMEVALRAMNLLAAFEVFRHSPQLDAASLQPLLKLFQQHADHIERNFEFSYIATSNHYLSDVVGVGWVGLMLPELAWSEEGWLEIGLEQILHEMDKQVLADGADYEASTGYHRYVLELLLYTFVLCQTNGIKIKDKYWTKLHQMLIYLRAYLRPDGFAPLIGDTDSGQVLPIRRRRADDHAYLLAIGAVVFKDQALKPEGMQPPEELLWLLGPEGVAEFQAMLPAKAYTVSRSFPQAGTHIMRDRDLYLCFNTSDAGIMGRGSHGHNDALSVEVSAGGRPFIVDPGTYVYSADLQKRHAFRSTAYHSTVQIDGIEQNTTRIETPFVIGNEAKPRVLEWNANVDCDKVVAEHYGYRRLSSPVVHRRSVTFDKRAREWLIEDEFLGEGEHVFEVRFHFAAGLEVSVHGATVEARDGDVWLRVSALSTDVLPVLESQPVSHDYGQLSDAVSACWRISGQPAKLSWKVSSHAKTQRPKDEREV